MIMNLLIDFKKILKDNNLIPNKLMGQNFLVSEKIVNDIVEALNIVENDIVVEIGSGLGQLTFKLAEKAKKVIAIEKDKYLVEILNREINKKNIKNIEVINEDVLKFNFYNILLNKKYKVVGNIPYYLTSALLRKLLELENQPNLIVFTVQKEVAERICAQPPKMSILSCAVQFYADVKFLKKISKKNFWPMPKVDSAIIRIIPRKKFLNVDNVVLFFKIVKSGFKQPRKILLNNLMSLNENQNYWKKILDLCKIKPDVRAEILSLDDWVKIYEAVQKKGQIFRN